MGNRGACCLLVVALAALSGAELQAASAVDIEIDLATQGASETLTVAPRKSYRLVLRNLLPSKRYQVSVERRLLDLGPFSTDAFSVGGKALPGLAPRSVRKEAASGCAGLARKLVDALSSASQESAVAAAIGLYAIEAPTQACRKKLMELAESLTTRQFGPLPSLGAEEEWVVSIERQGSSSKSSILVLTPGRRGQWMTSYGFTFVPNRDRRYFTEAVEGQTGMFEVKRQADREDWDFVPSIFFSYQRGRGGWGPAVGLGYDLEEPALFAGLGWTYKQNVMGTFGVALHSRSELAGRYSVGDILGESLDESRLLEDSHQPSFYLGVTLRFGSNIFRERQTVLAEVEKARASAAKAATVGAADLEVCLKDAELDRIKETAACEDDPCREAARAKAALAEAVCRQKRAGGGDSANNDGDDSDDDSTKPKAPVVPVAPDDSDDSIQPVAPAVDDAPRPRHARAPEGTGGRCGTPPLDPESRSRVEARTNAFRAMESNRGFGSRRGLIRVPVYFHVLQDGELGDLTDDQILDQIDVLNGEFRRHGFVFELAAVDSANVAEWFRMGIGSAEELAAKRSLNRSADSALNLYTADIDYLGWATLPSDFEDFPDWDGVVIDYTSIPGGEEPFDLGFTAVHEVGHWLGLEHTFNGWHETEAPEGGCEPRGDYIQDTPYTASPAFGPGVGLPCPPLTRDSCPLWRGLDPIDNFMDYADDRCMLRFTPGQEEWMKEQTALFRSALYATASGPLSSFELPPK